MVELNKQRNSSVELLRIIAMLFILLSHLCVHNEMDINSMPYSFNKLFSQWGVLGNLGVDIFVIISGYFLCTKDFSLKRLTNLLTQVWFYSLVLGCVFVFALGTKIGIKEFLTIVFPTIFQEYWFFTAYVVILIISPFINILVNNLNRKQFLKLNICLLILWVVIPTFTTKNMLGGEILQFIMFYLIGAYLKKYPENCFSKRKIRISCLLICWVLLLLSTVVIDFISYKFLSDLVVYRGYFYSRTSLLIVGIAISMFAVAIYCKPFSCKFVNYLASCVFGVYLIHENLFVRKILWTQIFNVSQLYNSVFFPIIAIGIVLIVFFACALVEFLRLKTIAKPISDLLERFLNFINDKILSILSSKNK